MTDAPLHPRDSFDVDGDDRVDTTIGPPRWVRVFAIVAAVVIVLIVVLMLVGGHGPARHT